MIKDLKLFDTIYYLYKTSKIRKAVIQGVTTDNIIILIDKQKSSISFEEKELTSFVLFGEYDKNVMYFTDPEKALRAREKNIKKSIADNNQAIKLLIDKGEQLSNMLVESLKYQLEN